ncbi:MAG: hypothetical protein ACYS15_13610 [Planctomycetota bacterium]|jgi:hypothetical protein
MNEPEFVHPIVETLRQVRDAHARFNYDLDAIVRDLRERQKQSGRTFIILPPRRTSESSKPPREGAA